MESKLENINKNLEKIVSMMENKNNPNEYFWKACLHGNVEVVKFFIKNGVNVNEKDKMGYPPIFQAVFSGKLEVVKLLVENGADIDVKTFSGTSLIDVASKNLHSHIIGYLMRVKESRNNNLFGISNVNQNGNSQGLFGHLNGNSQALFSRSNLNPWE